MGLQLSEIEVRVLGALVEKESTTPEYYPLSLNALVNACNQKSNRDPVMTLDEESVRQALRSLSEQAAAEHTTEAHSPAKISHDGDRVAQLEAEIMELRRELNTLREQFATFQKQFQ